MTTTAALRGPSYTFPIAAEYSGSGKSGVITQHIDAAATYHGYMFPALVVGSISFLIVFFLFLVLHASVLMFSVSVQDRSSCRGAWHGAGKKAGDGM